MKIFIPLKRNKLGNPYHYVYHLMSKGSTGISVGFTASEIGHTGWLAAAGWLLLTEVLAVLSGSCMGAWDSSRRGTKAEQVVE